MVGRTPAVLRKGSPAVTLPGLVIQLTRGPSTDCHRLREVPMVLELGLVRGASYSVRGSGNQISKGVHDEEEPSSVPPHPICMPSTSFRHT
jgi:hypothetical protein